MPGVVLAGLSWDEAEEAIARCPLALLPLGAAAKEHGKHLPLDTDRRLAEYLAARVAEALDVVVLPTLTYGHYPAFLEYPGSVSISAEAMRETVAGIARSLIHQGCRGLYVLNTGISTFGPLAEARAALAGEGLALAFTDLSGALAPVEARVAEQPGGSHADEIETSMMLVIAPEVVRMERARPDYHGDGPGPLTRHRHRRGVYSPTGAYGDPTLATVEKGQVVLAHLVEHLVADVGAFGDALEELAMLGKLMES